MIAKLLVSQRTLRIHSGCAKCRNPARNERNRYGQAEYWLSAARDYGLSLACVRRGLPAYHGRGFDDLPAELRDLLNEALVTALDQPALLRALSRTIELLTQESADIQDMPARIRSELRHLSAASI